MTGEIIIGGDFNARAPEWGMPETDDRGEDILDLCARLNLAVLNVGNTTTFRRPGYRQTILDISLASEDVAARIITNISLLRCMTNVDRYEETKHGNVVDGTSSG